MYLLHTCNVIKQLTAVPYTHSILLSLQVCLNKEFRSQAQTIYCHNLQLHQYKLLEPLHAFNEMF
jgi:C4-type Zn-finger protein